jgi:hypothetical protein
VKRGGQTTVRHGLVLPRPTAELRDALFGRPRYVTVGGAVLPDPSWLEDTTTSFSAGSFLPGEGDEVRVHRRVLGRLLELFDAWEDAGLLPHVLTLDRVFEWRPVIRRGAEIVGTARFERDVVEFGPHTHGNAFDINGEWNPLGRSTAREGERGSVVPLLHIARERGWWCGYDWGSNAAKHFELVKL